MKRLFFTILIFMSLILAACGGGDDNKSDNDNTSGNSTGNTATAISLTVTGAAESQSEGSVFVFCDNGSGLYDPFIDFGFANGMELLTLSLPLNLSGTVELNGKEEPNAIPGKTNDVSYRDNDGTTYNLGTGQLIIESYPTANGEMFTATMTAALTDESGNTVNLEASYNVKAGSQAFDECPNE